MSANVADIRADDPTNVLRDSLSERDLWAFASCADDGRL